MKSLKQIICTIYLAVLFIVYPLFQHDHYYSMGDNKYKFYLISTLIFFVLLAIAIITDPDTYKKKPGKNMTKSAAKRKSKNSKSKVAASSSSEKPSVGERVLALKDKFIEWYSPKSIVEKFVWAYLFFAIISFIFGIDHYTGFFGADGWYMGLMMQCIMIASFFIFAKVWEPNMLPFYFSMIGSSVVMLLGIVMRFGIDPLGNYEGLEQQYINSFISTIGQTSWYSAYICTVIPIGVGLFYVSEKKKDRIISGIYTMLSFLALAIADSDSILLGVAGLIMILFWVSFTDGKYMIRFFEIITMLSGSFVVMEEAKLLLANLYTAEREFTSVKLAIMKLYVVALIFSALIFIILTILDKTDKLSKLFVYKRTLSVFRGVIYIGVILVIAGIVTYIVLNTKGFFGVTNDMIPWNGSIWFFNNLWGHYRGASWMACWEVYKDYNIGRKLVGIGPDSLAIITQYVDKYREMIAGTFGGEQVLTCAHNEFYNHLVVYGLLGGGSYLGMYISGIKSSIVNFVKKPIALVSATCIASYMGHNFFCYQTVICTPFILVIMGIAEAWLKDNSKE